MTRIPLADFLGGGAAVAPAPKRMKLEDFLAGGDLSLSAPSSPASPPLSVPFVNQPTIDPLGDMLRTGGDLPYTPAAPPVQGLPEVQGVLDDWNLSGYTDPELKNPPSFELPKSALTPTAISDFNERKRAEEQRAEQQRMADLLSVFNGPNPGDPYKEGDRRLDSAYRNKLRSDYYGSLPYPMTEDVLAARIDPSTKHVYDRFRRLNELATGKLLLDEPQSITPEERDYRQKMIDNERAMMQARGLDPAQYLAELESFDGQQGFFGRNLAAMGNAASDVAGNIYDLATDTGGGQNVQGTRMRQQDAAWRETIEDIKDERSALPNWANEIARSSAQATPQLAGAAAVGLATKNPALATATMLGPAALDTYQTGRASGLSDGAAVGRAIALAGVEYATMKAGGAIAGTFGGRTFEEVAFGTGAKSTKRGLLGTLAEKAGSGATEGGEEVAAAIAQQVGDHLIGLEDELIGDETPEQLALAFAVGFVASGAMHGIGSFSEFVANPTAENAEAAGVTKELAPTQVDRESLAAAAQARIDALSTEAPQSPADALPPDTTSEPEVAAEVAQETVQEPELAAEPAQPVRVDSAEVPSGEYSPPVEPPRKRRLGDRITAPSLQSETPVPSEVAPSQGPSAEATPNVASAPKEPWQMTRDNFSVLASPLNKTTVPEVSAPTRRDKVRFTTQTLSGPKQVTGTRYWLPGYYGPDLVVSEKRPPRGMKEKLYEVYLHATGDLIESNNGVSSLNDVLKQAVQRLNSAAKGSDIYSAIHRQQVSRAIRQGKPVPPEVLADYPDLAQPTPSVAPPDAPPVAPSQVTADSGVAKETGYLNGDQIEYTGVITPDGMREFVYLEGAKKGQAGVRWTEAEKNARSEQNQRDWKEQQEGFKRLRESDQIVDANKMVPDVSRLQESSVQAQKQADGTYKLAYTGTRNEVFPGERFTSAWEARNYFKATRQKQRDAAESQNPATPAQVEVVAPTVVEAPKKRLGDKKAKPADSSAEVPANLSGEEVLPDWVTDDDFALEAPTLAPEQKQELSRIKRRLKAKLDAETFDEIAGMSEADQYVIASEADRRATDANEFMKAVIDDYSQLQSKGNISLIARNKERAGKDPSSIKAFDELVQQLRDGGYPSLAGYADSLGQGNLEAGLNEIVQGGKKALESQLVGPESQAYDVLEEYRERLERGSAEAVDSTDWEVSSAGFDDEPSGVQRTSGDARPEATAPTAQEADDFQLTGEGSRDTTPIVEPYKVAEKDRLPPKKKAERQPQLGGMPEDLDERVLEGQQGLFSANTGEQLQPASKPKVIVTPPKSQRQIIAELSKALDIPIRFGRQLNRQAGGVFYKVQNIITSKFANDVPVVTHEVGHKLDSMFGLSKDKKIAGELDRLGDPDTPGSRSSWTKSKSGVYKRGEGMAEFVRYWMTDPKKAKAEAPGTYEAFEAVLDANKDLGDALRQTQEDIRLWRTAEPEARLESQISIGENPNKTRYSLSQLTRDLVDDLHYLRLASEDAKLGDPDLPPSKNPYLLARNLRGSYGMASTFIQNGTVNFKTKDVKLGSSLEDALKPVGGRINAFRRWIVAKRAKELESQGRTTGFVKSDIDAVVKKYDGDADFEKAYRDFRNWQDAVLQYSVDSGLTTDAGAEAIRKMNQDYVPFHRLFEVGANEAPSSESTGKGSGLNPGKPGSLKRLKGSQRNIVDPLETAVKNAYAIITASEKSAISLAVADMAKLPNMAKWVEKVSGPMEETKFSVNDIRDQLEDMGADLEGIDEKGGDDMLSVFRQATRPPKGENTISVVRDGKTEFYRLNRYLHDTFEALDLDDAGKLVRILSAPAQVLRAGVTLEPGFNLANVMRDTVGAAVVGKYGALPFETTIRGIAALVNNPQLVSEWAASGGRSSVEANYFDRKKMQKYLAERIAKDLTPAERALVVAKSPLTALRWMATTFEEATRIGEYQKAYDALKKSGMADGEARRLAAFEARDRQDFAKGGAKTKILRHVAAFWNAQLQANVRLAQSFKERPVQTIAKGLAFVTLPKLIEQALNWDDEDYWERPQWERDLFYMVPIGKDDAGHTRFLRIPVPFEIGVIFATIPGRFMEWAKKNDPEAVKDIPSMFLKQTVPVPNPSGAVTVLELIPDQGYSYFRGREIVPDSMADMPKDLQWTAQTSTLAKKIGQATGISPMKVDYFIESTTGGTGKVALGKQVPGERFVSNPLAVTGQPISDFYAIRDQLKEDSERMKATGEHTGLGPVMLAQFEEAGEKIGAIRNKAREEADPAKKAKLEDEAYQMTREMVQKYRENPEPEEAVQEYAEKQAKKAVLSSGRPQQKKKKLGSKEPAETDDEYKKRLADWEESRDAAISWLKAHKSSPAVQAAVKEVAKDIPSPPKYTGRLDPKLGAKRKEWREKYGSAAGLLELLK